MEQLHLVNAIKTIKLGFQFRYKCAKPHACIQRYSLQRYYPSDLEVRLSHQYTLVNSTNKVIRRSNK